MEWKEPPEPKVQRDPGYWQHVVKELDMNPGEWAFVGRWSNGVATRIRQGKYRAFVPKEIVDWDERERWVAKHYEIYTCESDRKETDIYVRRNHN